MADTNCLLLDVATRGMTGPDLQEELKLCEQSIPILFITGQRDATARLSLITQGAVDCLSKPYEPARGINHPDDAPIHKCN